MACRGGPWPSRGPCAAAGFPGRCKHRPLQRFVIARGSRLAVDPSVGRRGGIYPARRRVSEANRRAAAALGPEIPPAGVCAAAGCGGMRASRPTFARAAAGVPVGRSCPGGHVGEGHAPPEPPRRRKPGGYGVRPCGGCISPLGRRARRRGHSGHFKTDTATRPRACLAGPGRAFVLRFVLMRRVFRPRGRRGCGGLSRGCRSCARRCAAAARRAAKR